MRTTSRQSSSSLIAFLLLLLAATSARADDDPNPHEVEFRTLVAEAKAAGEPTTPADLRKPHIPAEENGATHLRRALALVKAAEPALKPILDQDEDFRTLDPGKFKLRERLKDLPAVEAHLARAMSCRAFSWEIQYVVPMLNTELKFLAELRGLANYLAIATSLHRADNDHAAVLRRIRETLYAARGADETYTIVGHLVSIGIERMANHTAELFSPTLTIGDGVKQAKREEVMALIRQFLDDKPSRAGYRNALLGERVVQIEATELLAARKIELSGLTSHAFGFGKQEVTREDRKVDALARLSNHHVSGCYMLKHSAACLKGIRATNWPAAKQSIPESVVKKDEDFFNTMLARVLAVSSRKPFQQHLLGTAERRLAATALAIRLYAIDHEGRLPARLADLTPKYLDAVSLDPMTADQPLKYDPEKRIVYAVGGNEIDDGGLNDPSAGSDGKTDLVFRLMEK